MVAGLPGALTHAGQPMTRPGQLLPSGIGLGGKVTRPGQRLTRTGQRDG
jgi:hypothetical protein